MKRLRSTDGTAVHRRAARYHLAQTKLGTAPLHATLAGEMSAKYATLVSKARATEDFEDALVEADATVDAAEIALENAVREIDADLARMDRQNPALGAQAAVFPHGFGETIDPDGAAQLGVLPTLHVRLAPFKDDPILAPSLAKLDAAETALKAALKALAAADSKVDTAFAEEVAARTAIREQLESAYGRLRDHYKSRPALAEKFFSKEAGSRRAPKKESPAPAPVTPPPPATPVPA